MNIIRVFFVGVIIFGIYHTTLLVRTYYEYDKSYGSFWELADRSSTLSEKSKYINQFYEKLRTSEHSEYNALFYKTADTSFDRNLQALQSMKNRLESIKKMDEKSFEYQTAIQQITAQEMGEATSVLYDLRGAYILKKSILAWDWIGVCICVGWIASFIFLGFAILRDIL